MSIDLSPSFLFFVRFSVTNLCDNYVKKNIINTCVFNFYFYVTKRDFFADSFNLLILRNYKK